MITVYKKLLNIASKRGGYFILLDPEKLPTDLPSFLSKVNDANIDAFLIGGSTLKQFDIDLIIRNIKKETTIPVIIFPAGVHQVSQYADAILYLSFLQSHDPYYIIGAQAEAASYIRKIQLETISTAYILIESGNISSAERVTKVKPLPRNDNVQIINYAIASEILGFQFLYLEAGSGANESIPDKIITEVRKEISIPIIVGGGIKTPQDARKKIEAGANFVVTGNIYETNHSSTLFKEFANAIHN